MQKLTAEQTAELLRLYHQMPIEIKTLEIALKQKQDPDAVIYGAVVSQNVSGMPHDNGVSDKTQRVALEYSDLIDREISGIMHRITLLKGVMNQIDVVLDSLTSDETIVFKPYYVDGITWGAIASSLPPGYDIHSERAVIRRGKSILEKVSRLLNISSEELQEIKKEG